MKQIALTQGQFALVDDEDYEELSQFKWCAQWAPCTRSYYAKRALRLPNGKKTAEWMHRRILGLKYGDRRQGDHLNHVTLDNRRANVRIVSQTENQHNNRGKGYTWEERRKQYKAQIRVNGAVKNLGYYDDPADARAAYVAAKQTYHPSAPVLESAI